MLSNLKYIQRLLMHLLRVFLASAVFSRVMDRSIMQAGLLIVMQDNLHRLNALLYFVLEISETFLQM